MPETVVTLFRDRQACPDASDWISRLIHFQRHALDELRRASAGQEAASQLARLIGHEGGILLDAVHPPQRLLLHDLPDASPAPPAQAAYGRWASAQTPRLQRYTRLDALDDTAEAWYDTLGSGERWVLPLRLPGGTAILVLGGDASALADEPDAAALIGVLAAAALHPTPADDHARGVTLLVEISDLTQMAMGEDAFLQAAAEIICRCARADHVGIVSTHPATGETFFVAEHPATPSLGVQLPNDEASLTGILRRTQRALTIDDVATSPLIGEALRQILLGIGSRSMLLLPLLDSQRQLFGSVGIDMQQPNTLPSAALTPYLSVAVSLLAVALLRRRLEAQDKRQAAQLSVINRFARQIKPDSGLRHTLALIVETARALEPFDYVALYLYRQSVGRLQRVALWRDGAATLREDGESVDLAGYTPFQQAFMEGNPAFERDMAANPAWQHPAAQDIRTLVAYPLLAQESVIGVVELGSRRAYAYTQETVYIFQQFANEAAVVLSGVLAYEDAQAQAQARLRAAELSTLVQQQADMNAVVQATLTSLAEAFGAARVRIRLGTDATEKGQAS